MRLAPSPSVARRARATRVLLFASRRIVPLAALAALLASGCQPAAPPVPAVRGPVVLIVIDTLRADHLGLHGYARATSPALDAWARSGHVFEHALAPSPWTLPSMGSLLSGRWPAFHLAGVVMEREPLRRFAVLVSERRGVVTLAERLRRAGFRTGAVVSNPYLGPDFGLERGFDHYDAAKLEDERMRRADAGVDAALAWLRTQPDERYFLMLHLYDPHLPYDAPAPVRGRFTSEVAGATLGLPNEDVEALRALAESDALGEADRRFIAAAYDEEIAFVDQQVERVRRALEERGSLANALVVVTADHGEELFDHGGFEHGHALWQELLHVPFVVWGPGVAPGRSAAPISLVDLTPTVLEALGLPAAREAQDGVSLWSQLSAGAEPTARGLLAEGMYYGGERKAIVRWPHKLVLNPRNGLRRLVDLAADPREDRPITAGQGARADALQAELLAHIGEAAALRPGREAEIDEELRAQLEALGYAQ